MEKNLPLPAYEMVMKASHTFNLLDARHAISVTERQRFILRVRTLARAVAQAYFDARAALGFPMARRPCARSAGSHSGGGELVMSTDTLLVELGTEELPPKALKSLGLAFRDGIVDGLQQRDWATARCSGLPHPAAWRC